MRRPVREGPSRPPAPYSVAALLRLVRRDLEGRWRDVWVEGEMTDVARPRSGHVYFSLKDPRGDGALRAVMWASDARRHRAIPPEGTLVRAQGTLTVYEARGTFQMRVTRLVAAGEGDLKKRFEQLRSQLEAEGLLDDERKRALPFWPHRVGVVTSRDGAALRDVIKVLRDRVPLSLLLCHASVQGETAPQEIADALDHLAERGEVDVTIVTRGGGSGDDLSPFNDERVARAIARHPAPVISAVGHQVDVTIADLVADRRGATPSEAAVLVAPEGAALHRRLETIQARLDRAALVSQRDRRATLARVEGRLPDGERLLDDQKQRLDELLVAAEAALRHGLRHLASAEGELRRDLIRLHPQARVERQRARASALSARLETVGRRAVEERRGRLARGAASLDAMSPLSVLARGYALTFSEGGALLRSGTAVSEGDQVKVKLHEGQLRCTVDSVEE